MSDVSQVWRYDHARRLDYDSNGNLIYFGTAAPGSATSDPVWRIIKLDYSGTGNLLDVLFANGSRSFNQIWDNRVGLSYL